MAELTPEQRRIAFAAEFKNTGNLAQRRRYQEQIDDYAAKQRSENQDQYDRALGRAAMRDPIKAEQFNLDVRKESRLARESVSREDRLALEERHRMEERKLQNDLAQKKYELDQQTKKDNHKLALQAMDMKLEAQKQTAEMHQKIYDLFKAGIHEGMPQYAEEMTGFLAKHPGIPPSIAGPVLKGTHVDMDPSELPLLKQKLEAAGMKNPKMSFNKGPNGLSFSVTEVAPPKEHVTAPVDPVKQYDQLQKLYKETEADFKKAQENKNWDMSGLYGAKLKDLRDRMNQTPLAPGAQPAQAASTTQEPTPPVDTAAPAAASPAQVGVGAGVSSTATVAPTTQPTTEIPVIKSEFKDGKWTIPGMK